MYQDRILLTAADILKKDFKIDTRGYRPQEVDKFLDMIIHDYEETNKYIAEKEEEMKALVEDNIKLKQEIRMLRNKLEVIKEYPKNDITNADLLRRISNLEKIIYGNE